jgi:hypothetical protein
VIHADDYENLSAELATRVSHMSDDELSGNLKHWNVMVRSAAEKEAASRWAETIMPKDER